MTFNWNNINFQVQTLAENSLVITPNDDFVLEDIHLLAFQIQKAAIKGVFDIVPAYNSLTIYFTPLENSCINLIEDFEKLQLPNQKQLIANVHTIRVDFEKGLDWNAVEEHTKLTKLEIIQLFTQQTYKVAMLGFIPGFVYLEGLDPRLICPRKENPRKKIPAGSVGIGGKQAGIYALSSPGGWQIIGQTKTDLFDLNKMPPTVLKSLDVVKFESEF